MAAKSRMAPLKTLDIVRIELCGAVIGKRVRELLEKEIKVNIEKVFHITDNKIVQAIVWKESWMDSTLSRQIALGRFIRRQNPTNGIGLPAKHGSMWLTSQHEIFLHLRLVLGVSDRRVPTFF